MLFSCFIIRSNYLIKKNNGNQVKQENTQGELFLLRSSIHDIIIQNSHC
jgi:hypothetical protein